MPNFHHKRSNPVQGKSYALALEIVRTSRLLQQKHEFVISKQLLRSGTSIGANIEEALQAQSRADFIAKVSISHKEAFETHFWLRLIVDSNLLPVEAIATANSLLTEVMALLTSILKKTKENSRK